MKRILNIVLIALLIIAVIPMILWMTGVFGPFAHDPAVFGGSDIMLAIAAIYLIIAIAVMVVMMVMNIGKSKGNSKIGLFVFGACAVLAVVFYVAFSSAAPITDAGNNVYDDVFTLKIADTMLYLAYLTLGGCILFMLAGEVWKALK